MNEPDPLPWCRGGVIVGHMLPQLVEGGPQASSQVPVRSDTLAVALFAGITVFCFLHR